MSAFYIDCQDEEIPAERIAAIEKTLSDYVPSDTPLVLELVFADGAEIRRLNRETRNIDRVTDVLSYPALDGIKGKPLSAAEHPFDTDEEGRLFLGSVVICCERAREQAIEYGHSYERELHYLLVHGVMHCLGYDHLTEEEQREMRSKEEEVLSALGVTRE